MKPRPAPVRKSARNAGIGRIGVMNLPIYLKLADVGLERAFHLLHVAAEVYPEFAVGDFFNAETGLLSQLAASATS